jgi:hypothetical protein
MSTVVFIFMERGFMRKRPADTARNRNDSSSFIAAGEKAVYDGKTSRGV